MEYREFFERVKGFLEQAEIHKRRGNNDFNPYLEMWSGSNEVKLHSALISGFLNPLGNHYQGDVFLETFLDSISLKKWFGNTRNARVYKEYKNIDVYITNGERHIIVENKIWAGD
ncbi:PD-(D/E)XK nuclease family protein, partial [Helicobacter equorum]